MKIQIQPLFLAVLLCLPLLAAGKEVPPPPNPPKLVNDFTGTLTVGEVEALERKLTAYDDSTSTQIAIVIEQSVEGDDVFDYSIRLARAWGIGREGKSNGVLIYVAIGDRALRIQAGYGSEGFLPDALSKRIIDNTIKPNFLQGNYYQGLDRATDAIMQLGSGEYQNEEGSGGKQGFPWGALVLIVIFILLVVFVNRGSGGGGGGGGYHRGGRYDQGGGGWIFFPGFGGGGSGGGGWGGGGGGGGGFGGFGGGDFGGGGAGGDW